MAIEQIKTCGTPRLTMNLLARKLDQFADLGVEDKQLLDELIKDTRRVAARRDIIKEGERPNSVHLILSGFACRYRTARVRSSPCFFQATSAICTSPF